MITQEEINKCYNNLNFILEGANRLYDANQIKAGIQFVKNGLAQMDTHPKDLIGELTMPHTTKYSSDFHIFREIRDVLIEYIDILEPLVRGND